MTECEVEGYIVLLMQSVRAYGVLFWHNTRRLHSLWDKVVKKFSRRKTACLEISSIGFGIRFRCLLETKRGGRRREDEARESLRDL